MVRPRFERQKLRNYFYVILFTVIFSKRRKISTFWIEPSWQDLKEQFLHILDIEDTTMGGINFLPSLHHVLELFWNYLGQRIRFAQQKLLWHTHWDVLIETAFTTTTFWDHQTNNFFQYGVNWIGAGPATSAQPHSNKNSASDVQPKS